MERKRGAETGREAGLDDGDPAGQKRLRLCADFTAIAGCDAAEARRHLAENAWEMEVRGRGPRALGGGPRAASPVSPSPRLPVSP